MRFQIWFEQFVEGNLGCAVKVESFECFTAKSWREAVKYAFNIHEDGLIRVERIDDNDYPTIANLIILDDGGG